MPRFEQSEYYATTPAQAFALFRRTAERLRFAPPDLHLQLVEGPAEVRLGSRLTVKGRRWGVTQRMESEITAFEEDALIVEEQRRGPFRSWKHTQRFEPTAEGRRPYQRRDRVRTAGRNPRAAGDGGGDPARTGTRHDASAGAVDAATRRRFPNIGKHIVSVGEGVCVTVHGATGGERGGRLRNSSARTGSPSARSK